MSETERWDPELSTLRAITRAQPSDYRQLELSRFGLWTALAAHDWACARRWLAACETALRASEREDLRALGLDAVNRIVDSLRGES